MQNIKIFMSKGKRMAEGKHVHVNKYAKFSHAAEVQARILKAAAEGAPARHEVRPPVETYSFIRTIRPARPAYDFISDSLGLSALSARRRFFYWNGPAEQELGREYHF